MTAASIIGEIEHAKQLLERSTYTVREVAERYSVTRTAVYSWLKSGLIQSCGQLPETGILFDREQFNGFKPPRRGPKPRLERDE